MDVWMCACMFARMTEWMHAWIEGLRGLMDGWMDGWMDGHQADRSQRAEYGAPQEWPVHQCHTTALRLQLWRHGHREIGSITLIHQSIHDVVVA